MRQFFSTLAFTLQRGQRQAWETFAGLSSCPTLMIASISPILSFRETKRREISRCFKISLCVRNDRTSGFLPLGQPPCRNIGDRSYRPEALNTPTGCRLQHKRTAHRKHAATGRSWPAPCNGRPPAAGRQNGARRPRWHRTGSHQQSQGECHQSP